jgi:hypothetical protein
MIWVLTYAAVWLLFFLLFGMQRATLLISRNEGIDWKGGGELFLPKWFPLVWLVVVARWATLIAMAIFWSWKVALTVLVVGFLLTLVLPIPYAAYKGIFRRSIADLRRYDPLTSLKLKQMLDRAPF